jgi:hypothetical protein
MQVHVPAPSSTMLTIPGLAVELRVAPSHPRHPGGPLGMPPRRPSRPRVRSSLPWSWGRRRRWAVDRDLIGRPRAPDTGSASRGL